MRAVMQCTSRLFLAFAIGAVIAWGSAWAGSTEPCGLLTKAEVAGVLESPILSVTPARAEKDEETGGTVAYCTMRAKTSAVIVSVVSFASAKEAATQTTTEQVKERMDDDAAKVVEVKGLGDRAYWATTAKGAQYVVVKGSRVLGVSLGGVLPKPTTSYREPLKGLVIKALARL